ncbi:SnoaL-like domain-containing protein [Rhizobium rhizogenes]|uniref:SnoaL-like domain-containing protein n=1 Tax=Rhizobium rhizogenes (strain K84 / ATCC BAA-868) TaxID=311403 RepID=B9JMN3_RHIR8|nr:MULTISPECIES: nuclear transport factor 2 family protein [Rhizobium]ACM28814.1 hypothetical protein Arad_7277 [Rhizobium rhizogenes K84]OCJ18925.1 hypothetical protein A6U88_13715 [Agrobacterium sp. B131/95]EJK88112.1 hypothetical protein PMI03_00270 [Rhizobium sp. AP16]NTI24486.1 SnoaL-like domain-containing protein [Rhizobium rhizogenes]NTI43806.1 SnoaL-like domain-containing protein [Rhizobium rhizogenes]
MRPGDSSAATEALNPVAAVAARHDDWVADFFRDADSFQIEKLAGWFSNDVEIRFGNAPPVIGKSTAEELFRNFWSTIRGMRHRREELVQLDDMAVQVGVITYIHHDGSETALPVASHLRRVAPGKIDRLWIYIDMAPMYEKGA